MAIALYAAGVSQRKAAEVLSLLLGHRYTHETISAITDQVLEAAEAFRMRPLPEEMALVYLDGFFLKVLREGVGVERPGRIRGPGRHALRGAAGAGLLAASHGERFCLGRGF